MSQQMRPHEASRWRTMVRSLEVRNFRRYLLGQGLSQLGQWFQTTAELWLILSLTGSGTALGVHSALRFGPTLLFGTYGGLISDRVPRHRLLILTQSAQACAVTVLVIVLAVQSPTLLVVYGIVFAQGVINMIDNPLRRAFIRDLVDDDALANAVSLQGMINTTARAAGPALAGLTIALAGVRLCFILNAISYAAVLLSLLAVDRGRLRPARLVPRGPRQIREGLGFSWRNRPIRITLLLTWVVSVFAWNWNVVLPVYTTTVLGGGAAQYGLLVSLLSVGSVLGALYTAQLRRPDGRHLLTFTGLQAAALGVTAVAPGVAVAVIGLVMLGAAGTAFIVGAQSCLQLAVDDVLSGRVMALFSVGFTGSKPIGGLLSGVVTDALGPRAAFACCGAVVTVGLAGAAWWSRGQPLRTADWAAPVTRPRGTPATGLLDSD